MPKSWWNDGYKYIFDCIDVFSKKAEMIPMKSRDQETSVKAFEKILKNIGIPKTIYSDQGSEFNNKEFMDLLKKHDIKIIFATDHAPFIESFNKTMKNRLFKYMALHKTDNWSKALKQVLDGYNNTPHTSTGIAPNDINETNETTAYLNMLKKKKSSKYPKIKVGDTVRIPVTHKVSKGYKQQWSYELHQVEEVGKDGIYKVNGDYYPRKELQLIKGKTKRQAELSEKEIEKRKKKDDIGIAQTDPEIKDLAGKIDKEQAMQLFEPRRTRQQSQAKEEEKLKALSSDVKGLDKKSRFSYYDVNPLNIVEGKRHRH